MLLRERYSSLPLSIAGFSFGSRVALRLGQLEPTTERVIAVGFPGHYPGNDKLRECPVPRVFIHSRHDSVCPPEPLLAFIGSLPDPVQLEWVEAHDHFFTGGLQQLEDLVCTIGA